MPYVSPSQTGFSNLMAKRRHLVVLNPGDTLKLRTIDGEKTLQLKAFDGERTLRMPKVTFTPEQTEAILSLARLVEEAVKTATPARESRILFTAKLPAGANQVDIPANVHITRAYLLETLPAPKAWRLHQGQSHEVASIDRARQSTLNMVAKHCRRFKMPLDRTNTLRACRSALSVFGFDFMQLGDRRVICLKRGDSRGKMCLEIVVTSETPRSTEVCLLDYSRGASLSAPGIRTMLAKMQQVIEQQF